MLTQDKVRKKLILLLTDIQNSSGYQPKNISGSTCPLRELEGFDSMVSVASIGELATVLEIDIPYDKNIYISQDGKRLLTVDEVAAEVCRIVN
jgi:hypothetical protein